MNVQNTAPAFENPEALIAACVAGGGAIYGRFPAEGDRRVLLASHELGLNGAPIVLLYMARSLRRLGWQPVLISPVVGPLLDTLTHESFPVLICPSLSESDVVPRAAGLFRFVVLNTLVFAPVAAALNGSDTSVLWWLHEAEEIYHSDFAQSMPLYLFSNITVYADSPRSREHLLRHRPDCFAGVLAFGIPDAAGQDVKPYPLSEKAKGKRVFALVGTVERRKGQDVLLDAVRLLPEDAARQCFFVFVGPVFHPDVGDRVRMAASRQAGRFQYIPQLPLEELPAFYAAVDCVVCASRDDPGPITVVEGCQLSKSVICSEHTGMAPLLEEEQAGFVYGGDDPAALARCIVQLLAQSDGDAAAMRERGRAFYLSRFSPASFDRRLETEILPELLGPALLRGKPDAQAQLIRMAENSRQRLLHLEQLQKQALEIQMQEQLIREQQEQIERLEAQNRYLQEGFDTISNSTCWKITKPARAVMEALKRLPQPSTGTALIRKGLYSLRTNGPRVTWYKTVNKLNYSGAYKRLAKQVLFTDEELAGQREHVFPRPIKFSIVVPLYNTPELFLRAMIESVQAQTYADWELCMADGSDAQHGEVERVCLAYAARDERIRYRRLEKNLGISGNTNACLEMAEGDYIGLFDHDDLLHPAALYEVMRTICKLNADFVYTDEAVFASPNIEKITTAHFKPDFTPDNLRANNYICHFTVFKRSLLSEVGLFDPACDGSQDHDMVLRLTEKARRVAHIPEILYYWRAHAASAAESVGVKPYTVAAGVRAVEKQLERLGLEGEVEPVRPGMTFYRTRYTIRGTPKVSILIPNCEHIKDLRKCLDSIFNKTTWPNYELVIVENNSRSEELFSYYERLQREHSNLRVVTWEGKFNYSAVNNYGAQFCTGEYLLLLNNDIEVITPDWIQEMLMFAQRPDVGAVGAKLYYPNNTVQHAGVIVGLGGVAGHSHRHFPRDVYGYMSRMLYAQNLSAVTSACMLLRRDAWETVNGLDETWAVAFNDVDLCMRIRKAGYLIVWTPFAELYHHESRSRGHDNTPAKQERFCSEVIRFRQRWAKELKAGDPCYNPNLTLEKEDFSPDPVVRQHDAR